MFGVEKLKNEVKELKAKYSELLQEVTALKKNKPIGEFYDFKWSSFFSPTRDRHWQEFYQIQDEVDNKVKINNKWYDRSDVIVYVDQWKAKKKRIEAKMKGAK